MISHKKSFWHQLLHTKTQTSAASALALCTVHCDSKPAKDEFFLLPHTLHCHLEFFPPFLPVFCTSWQTPIFKKQDVYTCENSNYHKFCDVKARALGKVIKTVFFFLCLNPINVPKITFVGFFFFFPQWLRKTSYFCYKSIFSVNSVPSVDKAKMCPLAQYSSCKSCQEQMLSSSGRGCTGNKIISLGLLSSRSSFMATHILEMTHVKSLTYIVLFKTPKADSPSMSLSASSFISSPVFPRQHLAVRKILLHLYYVRFSVLQATPLYKTMFYYTGDKWCSPPTCSTSGILGLMSSADSPMW